MPSVNPISDQLVVVRARKVWASSKDNKDWCASGSSVGEYLTTRRAVIDACIASSCAPPSGDIVEYYFVVEDDGIIAAQGPEHNYTLRYGVPELLIAYLRQNSRRILVHITPPKAQEESNRVSLIDSIYVEGA